MSTKESETPCSLVPDVDTSIRPGFDEGPGAATARESRTIACGEGLRSDTARESRTIARGEWPGAATARKSRTIACGEGLQPATDRESRTIARNAYVQCPKCGMRISYDANAGHPNSRGHCGDDRDAHGWSTNEASVAGRAARRCGGRRSPTLRMDGWQPLLTWTCSTRSASWSLGRAGESA